VYARNGLTGKIDYKGTDASKVIQSAINSLPTEGGRIFVKAGRYILNSPLDLAFAKSICLFGEVPSVADLSLGTVFEYVGVAGVSVLNFDTGAWQIQQYVILKDFGIYLKGKPYTNTYAINLNRVHWFSARDVYAIIDSTYPRPSGSRGVFMDTVGNNQAIIEGVTVHYFEYGFLLNTDHIFIADSKAGYCTYGFYDAIGSNKVGLCLHALRCTSRSFHWTYGGSHRTYINPYSEYDTGTGLPTYDYFSNLPDRDRLMLINPRGLRSPLVFNSPFIGMITGPLFQNSGTATITAGSTYVDVTHELAITPKLEKIGLTPQTDLEGRDIWVSNPTSTTFRINISSVDTKDNVIGWRYY